MRGIDTMVESWTDRLHDLHYSTEERIEQCRWCDAIYSLEWEEVSESKWDGKIFCCENCRDEYDEAIRYDYEEV